jgi:hypothetical protein
MSFDVHTHEFNEIMSRMDRLEVRLRNIERLLNPKRPDGPRGAVLPGPGRPWISHGVTLPEGTELRMTDGDRLHFGMISGGLWDVNGRRHKSPSGAASAVVQIRRPERVGINGWTAWYVKRPGDRDWIVLNELRLASRVRAEN